MQKPSKFNLPRWNELAKELNARYREAVSHWNIARCLRSGPLAELKCRARAAFRDEMKFLRENEDQLRSQSMLSKLRRGECNYFWKEIKAVNFKKESLPLTVKGTSGESNIASVVRASESQVNQTSCSSSSTCGVREARPLNGG